MIAKLFMLLCIILIFILFLCFILFRFVEKWINRHYLEKSRWICSACKTENTIEHIQCWKCRKKPALFIRLLIALNKWNPT
ncbi:MAG: hypothetical protein JW774_09860 [Candidatus Aureabacteria bacterium]|nr:hypothetical protein [Candidatus Auribacterota bacterium]